MTGSPALREVPAILLPAQPKRGKHLAGWLLQTRHPVAVADKTLPHLCQSPAIMSRLAGWQTPIRRRSASARNDARRSCQQLQAALHVVSYVWFSGCAATFVGIVVKTMRALMGLQAPSKAVPL